MSTNTSVFWFWDRTISPFKSGPYLCTIGKVELERKGDKSSRHVWCFTWGRFDNRPDDPNSWIDFDEDGEWMIVAWAELPPACDIGQRFIQDKIDEIDEAHKIIVIDPDKPMREIPIAKPQTVERDILDLRNELDAYYQARTRLITQAETMRSDGIFGGMVRKIKLDKVDARIHALQIRIRDLQAKEEAEEDKEIFAGPQFNPGELASMTIGEFVRILKEMK